ncbi:MAG: hypothetical protein M3176_11080 [Chloroflexota bacterium]|nr:hypothetical protein [Chloroflexota bacterium]MDQ6907361.1 hypothetical protein [Chloroflexota bacterium]
MSTATQRWARRGMTIGMLLLTAALLSACIEANSSSKIGSDFKGTTNLRIGISKVAIQTLTSIGNSLGGTPTPNSGAMPDNIFGDLNNQVTGMGGTATPYDNGNFMGVDITMSFNSLDEMQNQINSILGNSPDASSSSSTPSSNPLSGSGSGQSALIQITAKSTDAGLRIDGMVDPLSTLNDPNNPNAIPGLDLTALLSGGGQVQLSFTMPGKVTSADALAQQNGNTVSWSFKVGDKAATIFAEANKS